MFVGCEFIRAALADPAALPRIHLHAESLRHLFRDLLLNAEHVLLLGVEMLRPEMFLAGSVDELHGDAYAPAALTHTAFEERFDAEFRPICAALLILSR